MITNNGGFCVVVVLFFRVVFGCFPVMKNPPKLEGKATDHCLASKHGQHVIGHIDDYGSLGQQAGEGKLLVRKIMPAPSLALKFRIQS